MKIAYKFLPCGPAKNQYIAESDLAKVDFHKTFRFYPRYLPPSLHFPVPSSDLKAEALPTHLRLGWTNRVLAYCDRSVATFAAANEAGCAACEVDFGDGDLGVVCTKSVIAITCKEVKG